MLTTDGAYAGSGSISIPSEKIRFGPWQFVGVGVLGNMLCCRVLPWVRCDQHDRYAILSPDLKCALEWRSRVSFEHGIQSGRIVDLRGYLHNQRIVQGTTVCWKMEVRDLFGYNPFDQINLGQISSGAVWLPASLEHPGVIHGDPSTTKCILVHLAAQTSDLVANAFGTLIAESDAATRQKGFHKVERLCRFGIGITAAPGTDARGRYGAEATARQEFYLFLEAAYREVGQIAASENVYRYFVRAEFPEWKRTDYDRMMHSLWHKIKDRDQIRKAVRAAGQRPAHTPDTWCRRLKQDRENYKTEISLHGTDDIDMQFALAVSYADKWQKLMNGEYGLAESRIEACLKIFADNASKYLGQAKYLGTPLTHRMRVNSDTILSLSTRKVFWLICNQDDVFKLTDETPEGRGWSAAVKVLQLSDKYKAIVGKYPHLKVTSIFATREQSQRPVHRV